MAASYGSSTSLLRADFCLRRATNDYESARTAVRCAIPYKNSLLPLWPLTIFILFVIAFAVQFRPVQFVPAVPVTAYH
jgi:hypothetical protein